MSIKWKSNKNFKPEVIINKIDKISTLNSDGIVSHAGMEYFQDYIPILFTMISFFPDLTDEQNMGLLNKAITKSIKMKNMTKNTLMDNLRELSKQKIAKKELRFYLLTSLSIDFNLVNKPIKIGKSNFIFEKDNFPSKFTGRETLCTSKENELLLCHTPKLYTKVIVEIKEKSEHSAVKQALDNLDLLRSIWSLFANSLNEYSFIGGVNKEPINKIRLGGVHTLHQDNGEVLKSTIWYEPNFSEAKIFSKNKEYNDNFIKNTEWAIEQLNKCKYSSKLDNALLRYVRAFDEPDANVALLYMWGALESITAYEENSKKNLPKRCSYLFEDYEYHRQVLEHLREYRNQSVHAGDTNSNAKIYCYQLQFYFKEIILFHLKNVDNFDSLEKANSFLDLPTNIDILKEKSELLNKAIVFRGGRDDE